jgi:hypothetical protein
MTISRSASTQNHPVLTHSSMLYVAWLFCAVVGATRPSASVWTVSGWCLNQPFSCVMQPFYCWNIAAWHCKMCRLLAAVPRRSGLCSATGPLQPCVATACVKLPAGLWKPAGDVLCVSPKLGSCLSCRLRQQPAFGMVATRAVLGNTVIELCAVCPSSSRIFTVECAACTCRVTPQNFSAHAGSCTAT